jgi:hypothetical protein
MKKLLAFAVLLSLSCTNDRDNTSNQEPSSRYRFKTGSYVEAGRNETFALCPPDKKSEGTWISEHSVALDEKNCLSVQAPNLAGTFRILFMENSGLTDTIQVLVDQSYIQMGDYSHTVYIPDTAEINATKKREKRGGPVTIYLVVPGNYESKKLSQSLIVDKTKFTMGDAWYYSKIDSNIALSPYELRRYKDENLEESKLPFVEGKTRLLANERSKKEGLDTAYIKLPDGKMVLDTSAWGYRVPTYEEWFSLMRAGASTSYYWGDEEDSLTVSRYAWVRSAELKPVAQLIPNRFGLYDMLGIANETIFDFAYSSPCDKYPPPECSTLIGSSKGVLLGGHKRSADSFRLVRKTPNMHKLEKF